MESKYLFYVGTDQSYKDRIQNFFQREKGYRLIELPPNKSSREEFFTNLDNFPPHVIFFDFTDILVNQEEDFYLSILPRLKNQYDTKGTLFVGLFRDKKDFTKKQAYISSGIHYFVVKSEDKKILIDISYIAFSNEHRFPGYAFAKINKIQANIAFPAVVSSINKEYISIESDLNRKESKNIDVKFNFFEDFTPTNFKLLEQTQRVKEGNYLYTQTLRIPYTDPWESEDENSLIESTMETWLDFNKEKMNVYSDGIMLISERTSSFLNIQEIEKSSNISISNYSHIDDEFSQLIENPKLILIDLKKNSVPDHHRKNVHINDISLIEKILTSIHSKDEYHPLIVVFNSPSESEALQKAFLYPSMISTRADILSDTCNNLISKFSTSSRFIKTERTFFKKTDNKRTAWIDSQIQVTSLTEHEITFISNEDIPDYSIFKIAVPDEILYIVIPPIREIGAMTEGKHYMAFAHGTNDDSRQKLRRFVNQIIYEPIKEYVFNDNFEKQEERENEEIIQNDEDILEKDLSITNKPSNEVRAKVKRIGNRISKL